MLAAKSGFSAAHWLCSARDKNLRVLLQQGTSGEWQLVPGSYTRALRAATCGTPQYYLRRSYMRNERERSGGTRAIVSWPSGALSEFCAAERPGAGGRRLAARLVAHGLCKS